jgi:hypothetical protein
MNKLLVTKDTLTKESLRIYETSAFFETPNINLMATSGSVFHKHFTTAPSTAMAMTSIITEKYPFEFGRTRYAEAANWDKISIFDKARQKGFDSYMIVPESWKTWKKFINAFNQACFLYYIEDVDTISQVTSLITKLELTDAFIWVHLPHVMFPRKSYGSDIDLLDEFIGKMNKTNFFEEIYLSADHGRMNLDKDLMNYGFHLYQSAVNIPLISSKKILDCNINQLTSHVNLYDIIFEEIIPHNDYVISETAYRLQGHRKFAVITERFKLIYNVFNNKYEFYDYVYDKLEKRNFYKEKKWDWFRGRSYNYSGQFFYPEEVNINNYKDEVLNIFRDLYVFEPGLILLFLRIEVIVRILYLPLVNKFNLKKYLRKFKPIRF